MILNINFMNYVSIFFMKKLLVKSSIDDPVELLSLLPPFFSDCFSDCFSYFLSVVDSLLVIGFVSTVELFDSPLHSILSPVPTTTYTGAGISSGFIIGI